MQLHIKQLVLGMMGLVVLGLLPALRAAETAPASQPANLVVNGDFQATDPAKMLPTHWTTKHPTNIRLLQDAKFGNVMEMTGDEALMGGYGVDLLSEKINFSPTHRYRVTGSTRSDGPTLILFVKGYATVTRKVKGKEVTADEVVFQMKKEIEKSKTWAAFNLDLEIKPIRTFGRLQHEIQYLRVQLWAYWPKGSAYWANLAMADAGELPKQEQGSGKAVTRLNTTPRLLPDAETQPGTETHSGAEVRPGAATHPGATRPAR